MFSRVRIAIRFFFVGLAVGILLAPRSGVETRRLGVRLADSRGQVYWKSLEELSASPDFKEFLDYFVRDHGAYPGQTTTTCTPGKGNKPPTCTQSPVGSMVS